MHRAFSITLLVGLCWAAPAGAAPSVSKLLADGAKPSAKLSVQTEVVASADAILQENLRGAATVYAASLLDELKLFAVADHVAAQFVAGKLPIGKDGGKALYRYHQERGDALDPPTRARMYAHAIGSGTSSTAGVAPNTEFAALWARFVHAANAFERAKSKGEPLSVSREKLRGAARELAQNLSNRSYGAIAAGAGLLRRRAELAEQALSSPAVLKHHGASNVWEVVEKVAKAELGGSANVTKLRARAEAGSRLIAWLASAGPALGAKGAPLPSLPKGQAAELKDVASAAQKTKPSHGVHALCFGAKKKLVRCKVVTK